MATTMIVSVWPVLLFRYKLWQCSFCDSSEEESDDEPVADTTLGREGGRSKRMIKKPTKFSPMKDTGKCFYFF